MSEASPVDPDRAALEGTLHTALDAGVRVQMSGGYTSRVYETMERVASAMGADDAEGSVSSVIVGLTVHRDGWSRTAFRRTPHIGVNFAELSALSELSKSAAGLPPDMIREQLQTIRSAQRRYSVWLVLPMLGVACGAFAALFGADAAGIVIASLGGALGAWVRHLLSGRHYRPFIFCLAAAFAATSMVDLMSATTQTPNQALAACVLFLVPGVPLLNGTADLLQTHYLNGLVRLTMSLVIVLASGMGVALALALWGMVL